VRTEQTGSRRGRDELIGALRVGHAAVDGRGPVLVEVEAIDAADRIQLGDEIGGAVGPQWAPNTPTQLSTLLTSGSRAMALVKVGE
jgi:hypothetical protein